MALNLLPFTNDPITDFSDDGHAESMKQALAEVSQSFDREYPMIINGEHVYTDEKFHSYNPCLKSQNVGTFQKGNAEHAKQAIENAYDTFQTWSQVPAEVRAQYLLKASAKIKADRFKYAACMVYEVGKSWTEADADVAEAIDFLEFYAREMLRLDGPHPLTPYPGESNELIYIPLGVGAIIPPWNFPFAILIGMATSAIVTGNTVVVKPAEEAMMIGAQFALLMQEIGLPPGVMNFVTGDGAELGSMMVNHHLTRFISFTGSKDVGLLINEQAAKRSPEQKWIKRVVAEMGGKDAMIIDKGVDTEEAATAIVAAAFGFQGQKCSACSRAIVVEEVYEEVLNKVASKAADLKVGSVDQRDIFMGAVINQESEDKVLKYIDIGKSEGRLVVGGEKLSDQGHFITPTVIADLDPKARLAQEEVFGPVLAFIKAKDFDHALEIGNNTPYGLTGGVFSNDELNLRKARDHFFVGNLYLNRKCTGALVDVQPFGGFNMSGTDSKAGGRDYLLHFMQAKAIARKL